MRDRLMAALPPKFGDAFDGDMDTLLETINAIKRAHARREQAQGGMAWRPIETAPRDGVSLWLFAPNEEPQQFVGYWSEEYDCWCYDEQLVQDVQGMAAPTHWMPLPEPVRSTPSTRNTCG